MNTSWFYVVLFMERTLQLSKVTTVGRSGVMLGSSDVAPDEFCREVKVLQVSKADSRPIISQENNQ
uniref:Uncharacterized protein n=1 Tax=Oryza punctata TaxID=4537 RepID=A0A0E0M162_ORYPU